MGQEFHLAKANRWSWAELGQPSIPTIEGFETQLATWKHLRISAVAGELEMLHRRRWPKFTSHWHVVWDQWKRPVPHDECWMYVSRTGSEFLTISYLVSGPKTTYRTLYQTIGAVDRLVRALDLYAVVCQALNQRLSERAMRRWGYEQHATRLGTNHYIKRFREYRGA